MLQTSQIFTFFFFFFLFLFLICSPPRFRLPIQRCQFFQGCFVSLPSQARKLQSCQQGVTASSKSVIQFITVHLFACSFARLLLSGSLVDHVEVGLGGGTFLGGNLVLRDNMWYESLDTLVRGAMGKGRGRGSQASREKSGGELHNDGRV